METGFPSGIAQGKKARRLAVHGVLAFAALAVLAALVLAAPYQEPQGDEPRYIRLGANLYFHGVLSSAPFDATVPPAPSLPIGGPLTAVELAAAMALDAETRERFLCFAAGRACDVRFPGLRALHVAEIAIFLASLWLIARRLTGRAAVAWLAVAAALICRDLTTDARRVLTEPLFLAAIGPTLFCWLAAWYDPGRLRTAVLLGLCLAVTILVKPVFLALVPLVGMLYAAAFVARRGTAPGRSVLAAACTCLAVAALVLAPFYAASLSCCGRFALADPVLLEAALAHRVAYNAMGVREWLAGWLYYLPDFGDQLAPALFPDLGATRLGWDAGSYYVHGRDVLHGQARAVTAPQPATGYLIRTQVLAEPLWHAVTSALLMWRGLFVGKLWALVALPFVVFYLLYRGAPDRSAFAVLCLPVYAIAALQSAISVSIPRYNLALIVPMSIAFSWAVVAAADALRNRIGGANSLARTPRG